MRPKMSAEAGGGSTQAVYLAWPCEGRVYTNRDNRADTPGVQARTRPGGRELVGFAHAAERHRARVPRVLRRRAGAGAVAVAPGRQRAARGGEDTGSRIVELGTGEVSFRTVSARHQHTAAGKQHSGVPSASRDQLAGCQALGV